MKDASLEPLKVCKGRLGILKSPKASDQFFIVGTSGKTEGLSLKKIPELMVELEEATVLLEEENGWSSTKYLPILRGFLNLLPKRNKFELFNAKGQEIGKVKKDCLDSLIEGLTLFHSQHLIREENQVEFDRIIEQATEQASEGKVQKSLEMLNSLQEVEHLDNRNSSVLKYTITKILNVFFDEGETHFKALQLSQAKEAFKKFIVLASEHAEIIPKLPKKISLAKDQVKLVDAYMSAVEKITRDLPLIYEEISLEKLESITSLSKADLENLILRMVMEGDLHAKLKQDALVYQEAQEAGTPVLSQSKKTCIVCRGKIQHVFYECSRCSSLYHLKCARELKLQDKGCFNCGTPFPRLPKDVEEDPVIVSIDKLSDNLHSLLTPEEITHKNLTADFSAIKKELVNELNHKISNNFYGTFQRQIDLLFEKFSELGASNLEQLDELKKAQRSLFNHIEEKASRWKQKNRKELTKCEECGAQAREPHQVFCETCGAILKKD